MSRVSTYISSINRLGLECQMSLILIFWWLEYHISHALTWWLSLVVCINPLEARVSRVSCINPLRARLPHASYINLLMVGISHVSCINPLGTRISQNFYVNLLMARVSLVLCINILVASTSHVSCINLLGLDYLKIISPILTFWWLDYHLARALKGLTQAKIIKKSVILFWLLSMNLWCKHVHRLELQKFLNFSAAYSPVRLDIETKFPYFLFLTWLSKIRNQKFYR